LKAATTKRYYITNKELEEALELEGMIEMVHQVTPYERDQEIELKGVDYIVTTVIDVEELNLEVKKDTSPSRFLDRHISK